MPENVKVAVRVRPFNQRELKRNAQLIVRMDGGDTFLRNPSKSSAEPKKFTFDYSYWSHDGFSEDENGYFYPSSPNYADQRKVFRDLGESLLDNAWRGYNCTLFAYGQTGSGKSYSVVGFGANKGIVPVTCEELFRRVNANQRPDVQYQISVSMYEIYNEQVRDLLVPSTTQGGLKVRQHPTKGFYVEGLTSASVRSDLEVKEFLSEGTKNRTIASTKMSVTSSRAHTIFTIYFTQENKNSAGQIVAKTSVIHLVDLAGSERVNTTGATGQRLVEVGFINKSLSALGNVIRALADSGNGRKVSAPFNDATLTKLLKNGLGGNSKTVLIAAISPADINYDATLSTLRFAEQVKRVRTTARVNETSTENLGKQLQEENAQLHQLLQSRTIELPQRESNSSKENTPHIWNLHQDPQLNHTVVHLLRKGKSILRSGPSIIHQHATVVNHDNGVVTMTPVEGAKVLVNGHPISDSVTLHHNDRILFGSNRLYVFHHPKELKALQSSGGKPHQVTYTQAQKEIAAISGVDISAEGKGKDKQEIQEELVTLMPIVYEANSTSEELNKQKKEEQEKSKKQLQKNTPHLWNLHEDPQLSHVVVHKLREGKSVLRSGPSQHATVVNHDNGVVTMTPGEGAKILVNGHPISDSVTLHHNDRILFGSNQLYVFNHPKELKALLSSGGKPHKVTYTQAQEEIAAISGLDISTERKRRDKQEIQEELVTVKPIVYEANSTSEELNKQGAAISPTDVNYDETLSTLRLAKQVKGVRTTPRVNEQVKLVRTTTRISEIPTEDVGRQLHEENIHLQPLLQSRSKETLQQESDISQEEIERMKRQAEEELARSMEANRKKNEELQKSRKEKYEESQRAIKKKEEQEKSKKQPQKNTPHLWNLHEDPQLNHTVVHMLREGKSVLRSGPSQHATVVNHDNGVVTLTPGEGAKVLVNGHPISDSVTLHHNDRILLGSNQLYVFNHPKELKALLSSGGKPHKVTYTQAQKEIAAISGVDISTDRKRKDELELQEELVTVNPIVYEANFTSEELNKQSAAISPTDVDYDETLSTLKFAKQVKGVRTTPRVIKQVKHVRTTTHVSETPTDDVGRQLQEENIHIQQVLQSRSNEIQQQESDISQEEIERMKRQAEEELARSMETNRKKNEELQKEKYEESQRTIKKKEEQEKSQKQLQKTTPHLWNLHEDPQLSHVVVHLLRKGNNILGSHAMVVNHDNGVVTMTPGEEATILVNGHPISDSVTLHHNDRILLGSNHLYVFHHPKELKALLSSGGKPHQVTYTQAQEEIATISGVDIRAEGKGKDELELQEELVTLMPTIYEANSTSEELNKQGAAISPTDVNYDETLSTLRLAKQVNGVRTTPRVNEQVKHVRITTRVSETPTEDVGRQLQEENIHFQQLLQSRSNEIPQKESNISQEEIERMKRQAEEQLARSIKEEQKMSREQLEKTTPHVWNLHEDPQLTHVVVHLLREGKSILRSGQSIKPQQATVMNHDNTVVTMTPGTGAKILVNGHPISDNVTLHHNDRILFGSNRLYVFHHPKELNALLSSGGKPHKVTYTQAQKEIAAISGVDISTEGKRKDEQEIQEELVTLVPIVYETKSTSEELNKQSAAISPLDVDYDETLSTLRLAKQVKGVQTTPRVNEQVKHIRITTRVSETPTEDVSRQLQEENIHIQQVLQSRSNEVQQQESDISQEDIERMKRWTEVELARSMEVNQEENEELQKEKYDESQRAIKKEEHEMSRDELQKTTPHLWNLHEDPQLSHVVVHMLRKGNSVLGSENEREDEEKEAFILLNGLSIMPQHAMVVNHDNAVVTMTPGEGAKILVNGHPISDSVTLHHNDRILFGSNHLYVFQHPKELNALLSSGGKPHQVTYTQAQEEIVAISGVDMSVEGKGKDELEIQEELVTLMPMVYEANSISEELNKQVCFEIALIPPHARGLREGKTEVMVKMRSLTSDNTWLWSQSKFLERHYQMLEMYHKYMQEEEWEVSQEMDPFWEAEDHDVLIGHAHVYMQSLSYMIEMEDTLDIMDYKGEKQGSLSVKLLPCLSDGSLPSSVDDLFVEKPEELLGQEVNFYLKISQVHGLAPKPNQAVYCKIRFYHDSKDLQTATIPLSSNKASHDFNYSHLIKIPLVNQQFLTYLADQPLVIEVWRTQEAVSNSVKKTEETKGEDTRSLRTYIHSISTTSTKDWMVTETRRRGSAVVISQEALSMQKDQELAKLKAEVYTQRTMIERLERKLKKIRELAEAAEYEVKNSVATQVVTTNKQYKSSVKVVPSSVLSTMATKYTTPEFVASQVVKKNRVTDSQTCSIM